MNASANLLVLRAQQVLARMGCLREQMAQDTARHGEHVHDYVGQHYSLDCELDGIIDALSKEIA